MIAEIPNTAERGSSLKDSRMNSVGSFRKDWEEQKQYEERPTDEHIVPYF